MKFKGFFSFSLILLVLVTVLDFLAFKNFWYWRWRWFDQPMHFAGGLLAGLVAIQIYLFFFYQDWKEVRGEEIILTSILGALIIGLVWEFFEFTADKIYVARVELKTLDMLYTGWRGSLHDLLFDLIGALTSAILFITSFIWRIKKQP
ncbi:MAG: hypothetical protein WC531_02120 [Candidatus Paceibacterota bacterium]